MYKQIKRTQEEFDNVISLLKDKNPRYKIEFNPDYSPELEKEFAERFSASFNEYNLNLWGYNAPDYFKNDVGEIIKELSFHLKKEKSLKHIPNSYIQALIDEFKEAAESFKLVNVRGIDFQYQPESKIYIFEGDFTYYTIDTVLDEFFQDIYQISQLKYDFTINMISKLEEILDFGNQPETSISESGDPIINLKLEANLSVAEIALLFRLMDEEKLFNYKFKTELFRFISNHLRTEKQDNISEASIKNKFLTPDNTAIKNLNIILTNLKIALNKI